MELNGDNRMKLDNLNNEELLKNKKCDIITRNMNNYDPKSNTKDEDFSLRYKFYGGQNQSNLVDKTKSKSSSEIPNNYISSSYSEGKKESNATTKEYVIDKKDYGDGIVVKLIKDIVITYQGKKMETLGPRAFRCGHCKSKLIFSEDGQKVVAKRAHEQACGNTLYVEKNKYILKSQSNLYTSVHNF